VKFFLRGGCCQLFSKHFVVVAAADVAAADLLRIMLWPSSRELFQLANFR